MGTQTHTHTDSDGSKALNRIDISQIKSGFNSPDLDLIKMNNLYGHLKKDATMSVLTSPNIQSESYINIDISRTVADVKSPAHSDIMDPRSPYHKVDVFEMKKGSAGNLGGLNNVKYISQQGIIEERTEDLEDSRPYLNSNGNPQDSSYREELSKRSRSLRDIECDSGLLLKRISNSIVQNAETFKHQLSPTDKESKKPNKMMFSQDLGQQFRGTHDYDQINRLNLSERLINRRQHHYNNEEVKDTNQQRQDLGGMSMGQDFYDKNRQNNLIEQMKIEYQSTHQSHPIKNESNSPRKPTILTGDMDQEFDEEEDERMRLALLEETENSVSPISQNIRGVVSGQESRILNPEGNNSAANQRYSYNSKSNFNEIEDPSAYDRDSLWGHRMQIDDHIRTYHILMDDAETLKKTETEYAWDLSKDPISETGTGISPHPILKDTENTIGIRESGSGENCQPGEMTESSVGNLRASNFSERLINDRTGRTVRSGLVSTKSGNDLNFFKGYESTQISTKNKDTKKANYFKSVPNSAQTFGKNTTSNTKESIKMKISSP